MTANYQKLRIVKKTVNGRRINRELLRKKLAFASFVPVPRLVKKS